MKEKPLVIRKRNFYKKALSDSEKLDVELASSVTGIDDEIELLRVKIKFMLENDPGNLKDILQTTGMLAKLVKINHSISGDQRKAMSAAADNIMRDLALPLGISTILKNQ